MLDLIEESEVNKLSLRKQGKKFLLYQKAIGPYIQEIENNIKKSEEGFYRIGEKTLRDILGEHLKSNSISTIRKGLQYCFWKNDIVIWIQPRSDGKKNFYFRRRHASDVLPTDLQESDVADVD